MGVIAWLLDRAMRRRQRLFQECCAAEGARAEKLRAKIVSRCLANPRDGLLATVLIEALGSAESGQFANASLLLAETVDLLADQEEGGEAWQALKQAVEAEQADGQRREALHAALLIVGERLVEDAQRIQRIAAEGVPPLASRFEAFAQRCGEVLPSSEHALGRLEWSRPRISKRISEYQIGCLLLAVLRVSAARVPGFSAAKLVSRFERKLGEIVSLLGGGRL